MTPVNITVDPAMIDGVITKEIQAAIIQQFNKAPQLIEQIVAHALKSKVSENGSVSGYAYENKYDFVDVLCKNAIQENAKATVQAWVEEKAPEISMAVRKALDKQKSQMTKAFADQIVAALTANFHISCQLNIEPTR